MTSKTIGIRELHRNLKRISEAAKRGQAFIVLRNATPVFRIEPLPVLKTGKKYTLADFRRAEFSGPKDLSKRIDEIVYGI
jgi:antitoxin (DNA-binding transcriptional repressor) of toxin-antitoxin stability system